MAKIHAIVERVERRSKTFEFEVADPANLDAVSVMAHQLAADYDYNLTSGAVVHYELAQFKTIKDRQGQAAAHPGTAAEPTLQPVLGPAKVGIIVQDGAVTEVRTTIKGLEATVADMDTTDAEDEKTVEKINAEIQQYPHQIHP